MAQYIDREAAVKLLRNQAREALEHSNTECEVMSSVADELEDFPAADVDPVVHCKDCVYSRPAGKNCEDMVVCTALSKDYLYMMKSDFCSYGTFKEATIGSDTD